MATWMQVTAVSHDNLTEEQIAQLEECISADANSWIEVLDGDWSLQRELDFADVISEDDLHRRLVSGETYGFVGKSSDEKTNRVWWLLADEVIDGGNVFFFDAYRDSSSRR